MPSHDGATDAGGAAAGASDTELMIGVCNTELLYWSN